MKLLRHGFLALALGCLPLAASAQNAQRPLRILVPFSAGGASDTYTRIAALKITEQTGRPIVVENRTGAGGRIAWETAAKSAPDGTTAALIDATYPMLPGLYEKLPWDVAGDLVPAAMICATPFVVVVGAESKFGSLAALIAEARSRPGKLNFGSAGIGSVNHVVSELFKLNARVDLTHIPYKGMSDASVALQAGQIDLIIAASPTALGPIKGGKARGLAVSTAQRSAAFPGVPTAAEQGVDYVVTNWFGFAFPKGTTKDAIDSLRNDVVRALAAPDVREKLAAQGAEPSNFTPEEFARFLKEDTRRWTELIRASGIKVE
ncbi:MAG TPA: tripartite tricarboxylate transporter substrate binding protein [Burkholderiales bacterium]|nr:tripartite tricarboxylate transporter substrate binding protein [Burkholderiales bacterium]